MATTVGSHAVAQFTSPVNQTSPIDANQVRGNDNTLRTAYVAHDADAGVHVQSSTLASRPVAGVAGRKWITADTGAYTLWYDDGSTWHEVSNASLEIEVLADANLVAGDVVKVTGYSNGQSCPTVNKVASAADVAFGIVKAAIGLNTKGYIVNTGTVRDVNTNAHAVGTILYPDASGGLTATKPTSGNYQVVAYVLRQNTNNGVLYVEFSAPRIVERSDNTVGTVVLRDGSGNFSAGTITAALTGNASTATQLSSNRTFALTGDVTGSVSSNLSSGASISTAIAAGVIVNDDINASAAIADTKLATISTAGKVSNSATTATSANTASAIVARDASGNFSAGTITANLTGDISGTAPAGTLTGTTLASNVVSSSLTSVGTLSSLTVTNPITGSVTGSSGSTTGNAATATALQTARTINGTSFDGTADITVTAAAGTLTGTTLASNVVSSSLTSVGTLSSLTVSGDLTVDTSTLKVDSANNRVGIGTASPSYNLVVNGASPVLNLNGTGTTGTTLFSTISGGSNGVTAIQSYNGGILAFDTGATGAGQAERMRIDASGNLAVAEAGAGFTNGGVIRDVNGSSGVRFYGAADGNLTLFNTVNSSSFGNIVFSTNNGTQAERARITAGGYFKASDNGTYYNATGQYHELRQSADALVCVAATASNTNFTSAVYFADTARSAGTAFDFASFSANGVQQFRVRGDGNVYNTNGVYGTLSDAKLKQDITDAGSQWDDLKAIRFRKYRFISDVDAKGEDAPYLLGVVAQELRETSPGLVDAHPDTEQVEVEVEVEKSRPVMHEVEEVVTDAEGVESVVTKSVPMLDADGQPVTETYTETETRTETRPTGTETLSVKQSILLMKAAVALQEAMARIETLEARLAAAGIE